jgi:hypothetical protein
MASATAADVVRAERSRAPTAFPVLLGVTCLLGGLSLLATAFSQARELGGDSGYLHHLLALNAPASGDIAASLGPAGARVDNMGFVMALSGATAAAALLLVAAGFFLTSAQMRHPDAARRVAAVGLWTALAVSLLTLMPVDAGWGQTGVDGIRTGLVALCGLFLLQISAPQWRASLREAFRD